MSLLEKYLEGKKELHVKFDEIHEECEKKLDAAGCEFLAKFKEMIANASDEEFHEFMCSNSDEFDEIERMAALTARLESYGKRCKDKEEKEPEDKPKKDDGPHVVIIGLG